MDQLHPPQPPKPPVAQELPHLVVGEQKRSPLAIFGIVVLSLLLLGLPVGIFLVSKNTQFAPKAAVVENLPEVVTGIFLESKLSLNSGDGVIPVDVYIKSPLDAVNLVKAQISFNPGLLNVDKIATGSADINRPAVFNKWIEASFDNSKGTASIISGLASPGIKTGNGADEKIYLGTLFLKPQKLGTAILQVATDSQMLRNSDNVNVFKSGNDLALNLPAITSVATASAKASAKPKTEAAPLIVLTSPSPALNYSYFRPVNILWSSFNVEIVSAVNLYSNGELLGPLAQNLKPEEGKFEWNPQESLALHSVQSTNTYQVELIGVSKDGQTVKTLSAPFGILGTVEVNGTSPNLEALSKNQLTITDASRLFTDYLVSPPKDTSLDLNKDGVLNDLDLFLIRQNLLVRGVIK